MRSDESAQKRPAQFAIGVSRSSEGLGPDGQAGRHAGDEGVEQRGCVLRAGVGVDLDAGLGAAVEDGEPGVEAGAAAGIGAAVDRHGEDDAGAVEGREGVAPGGIAGDAVALDPVVAKDALLVSDGGASYPPCAAALGVSHETLNRSMGERVRGDLHVQTVNSRHSRLKDFLRPRRGITTRYLDNYLSWFHIVGLAPGANDRACLAAAVTS